MRLTIFIISFSLLLEACTTKNEFFKLNNVTYIDNIYFTEHVVMTNPHQNKDSLLLQVKNYMEIYNKKYQIDQIDKIYSCAFYKETWDTPRDYEEDPYGYFGFDEIGHHGNDQVACISFMKDKGWEIVITPDFNDVDTWRYYKSISLK